MEREITQFPDIEIDHSKITKDANQFIQNANDELKLKLQNRLVSLATKPSPQKNTRPLLSLSKKTIPALAQSELKHVLPPIMKQNIISSKRINHPPNTKHQDALEFISTTKMAQFDGFVYLRPKKIPLFSGAKYIYNMYDLEVINYLETDKDQGFITLSSHGVTYFDKNGYGEFTDLKAWVREYHLFQKLNKIHFFGQFKSLKLFRAWKISILRSKIFKARETISKSLFLCDSGLGKALFEINTLLLETEHSINLFHVENGITFDLDDFISENEKRLQRALSESFLKLSNKIKLIVQEVSLRTLIDKGFKIPWDIVKAQFTEETIEKLTFTEQGARRNECKRLQHFVKLVDYLLISTLRTMALSATHKTLKAIFNTCDDRQIHNILMSISKNTEQEIDNLLQSKHPFIMTSNLVDGGPEHFSHLVSGMVSPSKNEIFSANIKDIISKPVEENSIPLFYAKVMLDVESKENQIVCQPDLPEFTKMVRKLFKNLLDCTDEVEGIINTIGFLDSARLPGGSTYTVKGLEEPEYSGNVQFSSILMSSGFFIEALGRIWATLDGSFQNVWKWISTLKDIRETWIKSNSFDVMKSLECDVGTLAVFLANADAKNADGGISSLLQDKLKVELMDQDENIRILELLNPPKTLLKLSSTIASDSDEFRSLLIDFFNRHLSMFTEQLETINKVPETIIISNILLDLKEFKAVLTPNPERCLRDVVNLIPDIARDKNELMLGEIQSWVKLIKNPPSTVEAFVEYLAWIEKINSLIELVDLYEIEITQLYSIIDRYKIKVEPTDVALFQTLSPNLRQLKDILDIAIETREDCIHKYSLELVNMMSSLSNDVSDTRNRAQDAIILDTSSEPSTVLSLISELSIQIDSIERTKNKYENWGSLFQRGGVLMVAAAEGEEIAAPEKNDKNLYDPRKYEEMMETKQEISLKKIMWAGIQEWNHLEIEWNSCPFEKLDVEKMNERIIFFSKTVYSLEKGLPPNEVTSKLKSMVEVYKTMYPTIMDLRSAALKSRHWDKIQEIIGQEIHRDETLTLKTFIEYRTFDFKSELASISGQASSEFALEEMLTKVTSIWNETELTIIPYKDSKDIFVLSGIDELQVLLDDSRITVATIKSSRNIGPIKNDLEKMDRQLTLFSETLDSWITCQRSWMYVESIFSASDIQRQLPDESKLFIQVDRSWKDIMRKAFRNPNALRAGTLPGLLELCQQNNAHLDQIQKCLEDYLESKRLLFPRFYFLSNEELLEILAQTKNPLAVQPHLSKCFDAVKSLEFTTNDPKNMDIMSILSPEGEKISFLKPIKTRGNIEAWLSLVEETMMNTLRRLLKNAVEDYSDDKRAEWVLHHPGQVVLAANQIIWTSYVQECLESRNPKNSLTNLKQKWVTNLSHLAALVRGDLTKVQRAILGALITIDVHNRDIIQSLLDNNVDNTGEFDWIKQLRYYWDSANENCYIKMSSSTYDYGFEYLGCSARLVITTLTDRCYLTLIGALELNLGGSPMGPAGTGKTETVKDLAKALAKQCVVLNCSDGMDYKMMGKIFAGLAQSGAWCCFDEFNRIDIEVLSVVAQQLLSIKQAKDTKAVRFIFEGRDIRLINTCAAFITMNPGYAGRSELPDNLKALFRPIAMMIPDYGLIAEIMLFSEGFESAKILSAKVVTLYKLCSEQLSQQDHYDFGMRAVKSVLVMAGSVKRANLNLPEDVVVMRSLKNSNLPKFLDEDVPLFNGILTDLFPGIENVLDNPKILEAQILSVLRENNMDENIPLVNRIIQLWETMKIRHGVMLVGPTGGGKTTCYKTLYVAMNKLSETYDMFPKVQTWILNPKCISMQELYGEFNLDTLEWKDGLMGTIFRAQVSDTTSDEKWTICDGPVDALWIENMNTVLDDNKLLTLVNGERIKMNQHMHMLFEVQDLSVASPATVSRCGMVYMDPASLGWKPFTNKWLKELPSHFQQELREELRNHFDVYVEEFLFYVRRNCKEYVPTVNMNMVTTLCRILTTFINRTKEIDFSKNPTDLAPIFGQIFVFACVWAFGGNLADGMHDGFDTFIRELFANKPINDVSLPSGSSNMFSYYFDFKRKSFSGWENQVSSFKYSSAIPYFQLIVPTTDTAKYSYLLETLLCSGTPVLLSGQSGVGKSVIIQDSLRRITEANKYLTINLNFSAQTTSLQTQNIIESKMEKKRKAILGAPVNINKVVIFIDDLNMPRPDTYGSQPPLELIRQLIDTEGFYDRETLKWKQVQDTVLVAACAPPSGGRKSISPRLTSKFSVFNILQQNDVTLTYIFRAIIEGFLKPFSTEIRSCSEAIVSTSIEVYRRMSSDLLPTPAKSHYTFNLRDLSKIFQGMMQIKTAVIQTKVDLTKLLYHEVSRIFHDRLINESDRDFFNNTLTTVIERNFVTTLNKDVPLSDVIFGDFEKRGVPVEDRVYAEILDTPVYTTTLDEYLEEYNVSLNKDMNLIFFKDARKHLARLTRILRQPRGNAMLVGVGGTGKQSLTKLACHILEIGCHQIEMTRNYSDAEWKEDIRKVYRIAGAQRKHVVFLLTDSQIKDESFLEDINSILNTGEVPNLFEPEEREKIFGELRQSVRERGLSEDKDSIANYFSAQIRLNLHIVFATSPIGETFRNRCRMFPSLVNCTTIDWFDEWPSEALLAVSRKYFEFIDVGSNEMKESIANACVSVHTSVQSMSERFYQELKRRFYSTPTSYLELIGLFTSMLQEKRKEISMASDTLNNGLTKLAETNDTISKMQVELELLQPVLKQKALDVEVLMLKITKDQETADVVRKTVMEEEAIVRVKAEETQKIAIDAQADLDQALPALEAAYKALDALDKKDIAELKVFTKPPELVALVLEAICILFKVKPDWDNSKKLMSDPQFMKKMTEYDKENIPEPIIKKLRKYIETPNFNPESVERVSKACKSMCMWVIAMELYSRVYKEVEPKRKILEKAQTALEETQANLAKKTAQLQQVEQQLERLRFTYEQSISEKQSLVDKASETGARLVRAGKLTTALADEEIRWTESAKFYKEQLLTITGNIFLSAASVAYFGAFTASYRKELVNLWHKQCIRFQIPVSEVFSLSANLVDPAIIREWNIQNLPSDDLSTENAILATRTRKWPLMIDPQGQANRWIRSMEGPMLKCLKLNDPKLSRALEGAIRLGQSVLIEDIEETLDPVLEPILVRQLVRQGGRLMIKFGDSMVEYDRNFKLYMTTKLSNPHYLPEVCIKCTIINFTVTKTGLEGQLLGDVVRLERPELELQRNELIINISNDKKVLKEIEEKILKTLYNSKGNILDDEDLINTLNQSKTTSEAVKERVYLAEFTEKDINFAREKYIPVAVRGAICYFVMADLAEIDPMYQFSLKYFKNLFSICIKESKKTETLAQRIDSLLKTCTYDIFSNVSRGLFDSHKIIYAFLMICEILKDCGEILSAEWNFFVRGPTAFVNSLPKPSVPWLTAQIWDNILATSGSLPLFSTLHTDISNYAGEWVHFMDTDQPLSARIPWNTTEKITDFRKLILIKCLREESVATSILEFVKIHLGVEFIDLPPLDLFRVYKDTKFNVPLMFILSAGSDPVHSLQKLAALKEIKMSDRLTIISLGQGQGLIAEQALRKASQNGDWIFLQNCHLAASFMPRLETLLKEFFESDTTNTNFRLFLSSMPSSVFPVSILQDSVKITSEPPKGLRANLIKSFADISQSLYDDHPPQGVIFRKLLFGLVFFNAIIHERKKFGPLGWNIMYDWSQSDLEVSILNLRNILMDDSKSMQWDALKYLTGEISFGGRVTDEWDRRTVNTLLRKYYTPEILKDSHVFTKNGKYYAPENGSLSATKAFIDSLPFAESPEVFGMHDNANIVFQIQEGKRIIRTVLDVQPRIAATGGASSEELVSEKATKLLQNLPSIFDIELITSSRTESVITKKLFARNTSGRMLNTLSTVLLQEMVRFNKLLSVIKLSLQNLINALKGLIIMSSEIEKVFKSLLNNAVPMEWASAAYPSLKPLVSWMKNLIERVEVLNKWTFEGQPGSFWLSGFFFPQGFLTGLLQNHSRKYNIPIDNLRFSFQITEYETPEAAAGEDTKLDGALIYGLFLEGARWDKSSMSIEDSLPMEMQSAMPLIRFIPSVSGSEDTSAKYPCPLYKTSARAGTLTTTGHSTNFVLTANLPTKKGPETWISCGVALLVYLFLLFRLNILVSALQLMLERHEIK